MRDLYESQRAMRNMRRTAMQRGVIAILDVGTSKIACLVLRFDGPDAFAESDSVGSMAGQSSFRVIGAATTRSRGVRFGEVDAMQETERAIRTAVQAAQKMANVRVDHVIACFAGARPRSYGLDGVVDVQGQVVADHDIGRVLAACEVPDFGADREVLHAQPVNFSLDHRTGLSDPRGQIGNRLTADLHLLTVDATVVKNLLFCIKRCDLELAGLASSAYVSGIASLVEDEQELGSACIDMGGGATGLSIFIRKHMIYADNVRMGGDHVTSDISMGLQVPMATAERIKTLHGGVVATGMDDREMIEIGGDTGDWHHDRRTVSRAELIGIMRPRVEEILEEVRLRLDAAGFEYLPSQQIVLTGGGSQIPGLDGLASKILGQQVRLGRPLRVQGLPQAATGPSFSGAVGLSLFAANPQDEWWDFDVPTERHPARSFRRAVKWFKDNW
ncbi:cell division protein FtsA [Ponticoccus sp. SC2-23]|uniref:cell division protein FtsA n=1 Tax=Alexandriicola marinus TaxID=2081710 RepID=UPI000FDC78CD|nr:cell division protein FtsA [Alexandriicola marinus]MBM1219479.1 cell division protein FtsA [Ponticoccus sp. SC6-9]MBM1223449.1 cell division protein FtsA [Ponticoccus sp. SC6-15]MBM1229292.1 cell division protein FtsA [Ponticoccus sp. SC6-38]MBM1232415.1 cell division protein FtsA [Ponticoccus sp. SC6-45]MBM1237635.1 cell division protein FtsA [Ponticoccus sp. SC6-49]MBM1241426.1 cell division protein FtsA [Ponticoccus sp. SC2-64]MBM1245939.1 cell division protein FtsA [Ponticoccus sp. SC